MGNTNVPPEPELPESLLARARAGNAEAFCQLATAHEARLLRQAFGLSRDLATAEDLASETLVEAWRSLGRFDGSCRFSTWLFSILLHRFQKHCRAARSRPVSASSLPDIETCFAVQSPDEALSPAQALQCREKAAALRRALELLPERQRKVLLLRFFQDCSLEEVAGVLGCSVGTVKSRLHYGLENLRAAQHALNLHELKGDT